MRWGDMDAQGHVNNASFLDYLQEARVDFLLSGPQVMHDLLESGVLVVSHQVEYLAPIRAGDQPLTINLWVDAVGGSKFAIGYDLLDGDLLAGRARTALVPFDLARDSLRRLTPAEREVLLRHLAPAEPLRSLPRVRWTGGDHRFPFTVRWSDLDSYGHVNNVKFFDYVQEARIDMIRRTVGWSAEDVWLVARQDLEYLRPLDFRREPYEVGTVVAAVGRRSITLAVEVRAPESGTAYATARTVVVGVQPLTDAQREALNAIAGAVTK